MNEQMQPPQGQQPTGMGAEEMPHVDPVTTFLEALTTGVGVETVFGNPVTAGEQVIIPVAETTISGGAGYGQGPRDGEPQMRTYRVGGGGAGGGAHTRPVAAIVVTPGEVRVQPIIDVGKLALSGIVSAAAMWQGVAAFIKSMRKRR